jgi:hypothetical protein
VGRRLVVTEGGEILAAVLGSAADGVMLASAKRLFDVLTELEARTGEVLDAMRSPCPFDPARLDQLAEARVAAAQALILASDLTEH